MQRQTCHRPSPAGQKSQGKSRTPPFQTYPASARFSQSALGWEGGTKPTAGITEMGRVM